MVNFLKKTDLRSKFVAQILTNLNTFSVLLEVMYNYITTQGSPHDPSKLAIHSILRAENDLIPNCGHRFRRTLSFGYRLHFIDEENIVSYVSFDCGITFYPEAPMEIGEINRELKNFSSSCEKPSASQITIA